MKKGIFKILALLVALSMMFVSLTACQESDDKNESSSQKPQSSSQTDEATDSSDDGSSEEIIGGNVDSNDGIVVSRPELTDGAISVGIIEYDGDDILEEDPDLDSGDGEGYEELPDIEEAEDEEVNFFVQKYGKKASGKTREITVDNKNVLFKGWYGLNANCFPTQFTYDAQTATKDVPAYAEINAKRYNEMQGKYMRSWFQIDWIITNECAEKGLNPSTIENWEDNPDYVNYMNNVYDFDNDAFNSAVEYWQILEEAGTEIYLAYGWKIATRIQPWFGMNPKNPQIAGPYDLKKYAEACVALFKHCRYERGLTNFNTLAFYNEPDRADDYTYQGSWDYQVIGNKCVWWAKMTEECRKALNADKKTKDVRIMVADCSNNINVRTENYVNVYMRNHATDYFDDYTFHCYPSAYNAMSDGNAYDGLYDSLNKAYFYYNDKPRWITEYYTTSKDIAPYANGEAGYDWEGAFNGWNCSMGAYVVASAHNGFSGLFKWSWVGGYLLDPLFFDPANGDTSNWIRAVDSKTLDKVMYSFYQESLFNTYVRHNSNVHNIEWTGTDIRPAAFTSKDGKDFTLFVETNEGSTEKDLKVKLKKSLGGRTIYVFRYNWNVEKNAQATIIPCIDTIENVGTSFTYHTDDLYGDYYFTTYKPIQSLEVYEPGTNNDRVYAKVNKNDTVSIEARFVENVGINAPAESDATIGWEIKYYSEAPIKVKGKEQQIVRREKTGGDMGSVSVAADGVATYTPPADASGGDVVALRAYYKNDPDRFASVIVEIDR